MSNSDWVLIHYTDCRNFAHIQKTRRLRCAWHLMNEAERTHHAKSRRQECVVLGNKAILRDQQPLSEGIVFSDGATLTKFVKYLNHHVFFWANNSAQAKQARESFRKKYPHPQNIGLRCKLSDLQNKNPDTEILFSPYNSGATPPRPEKSQRSLNLFQPLKARRGGEPIVEVVVQGEVRLPDNTEYEYKNDKWQKLFTVKSLQSPPVPDVFSALAPINGVRLAVTATGVKYHDRDDLMLASFCPGTTVAGVFTQSSTASAPVLLCREHLQGGVASALIVNSGNANAFTGKIGEQHCQETCHAVAKAINCDVDKIFVASTGVIGERLPIERMVTAIPKLADKLQAGSWQAAARAITTTDTFPKGASIQTTIGDVKVSINGFAKGSGMIEPDMATMLAFIFTDAKIPARILQEILLECNQQSFNCITVDSDTSTSDTCLLFATGKAGNPLATDSNGDIEAQSLFEFKKALQTIMLDLAKQVIRDGEGATKLIEITVSGAESARAAKIIAKSIANSPLVKTAIAGEDANWGRIVMAVGKSGQQANRDKLKINIGGVLITENGQVAQGYDEARVSKHLKDNEIFITVDVGIGSGVATVWTCDLTHGYIQINADYRS